MTTVERIFNLIEENYLTAKEFATMCELSPGNVTDWKTGRAKPSIESLKKISSNFNVNIDWLLGESSVKEKENLYDDLKIPFYFKYYIEDLPACIIYKIKFITHILLISNHEFQNIENEVNAYLSVYQVPGRFKKDTKRAILYLYNYNITDIIKSTRQNFTIEDKQAKDFSILTNFDKYYMCPIYGQISAGQPNWAEECMDGKMPIDPELMNIVNPEECFFLKVKGESMNKLIKNGAFALIRKTDVVENGEVAVVLVNGYNATLKKFKVLKNGYIMLEPQSNSDEFEPIIIDPEETNIKILGKYIGKMEMQ